MLGLFKLITFLNSVRIFKKKIVLKQNKRIVIYYEIELFPPALGLLVDT